MSYELKTFKVDETVNQRFKEECVKLKLRQQDVLELLMVRWVKMRNRSDKKSVQIYKD